MYLYFYVTVLHHYLYNKTIINNCLLLVAFMINLASRMKSEIKAMPNR